MSRSFSLDTHRAAALVVGHVCGDRETRVVVQLLHEGRHIGVTFSSTEAQELADRITSLVQELEGGGGQKRE